jgi:hypothetical protein
VSRAAWTRCGRKDHGYCCWCKRELVSSVAPCDRAFTFDHVLARSRGGLVRVPCCAKCNMLKADLPRADWSWFIDNNPRWWKRFSTPQQVRATIIAERSRRAFAGEPPISLVLLGSVSMPMTVYR